MSRRRRRRGSAELARPPGRRGSLGLGPGPRRQHRRGRDGVGARADGARPWKAAGSGPGSGCAPPREQVGSFAGVEGASRESGGRQGLGLAGPEDAGGESRVLRWKRGVSQRCPSDQGAGPARGTVGIRAHRRTQRRPRGAIKAQAPRGARVAPGDRCPGLGMRRGRAGRSWRRSRRRR